MFRTIISPKQVEPITEKNKDYSQEFVRLVGLYTHSYNNVYIRCFP